MSEDNIKLMANIPLFRELTPKEIMLVVLAGEDRSFLKGERIIREGGDGEALYIIKTGSVKIVKDGGRGVKYELAELHAGENFGELALIDNVPRSASAYASSNCELLRIPREELFNLMLSNAEIERKFYKAFTHILAERLRKINDNFTFCQEVGNLLTGPENE